MINTKNRVTSVVLWVLNSDPFPSRNSVKPFRTSTSPTSQVELAGRRADATVKQHRPSGCWVTKTTCVFWSWSTPIYGCSRLCWNAFPWRLMRNMMINQWSWSNLTIFLECRFGEAVVGMVGAAGFCSIMGPDCILHRLLIYTYVWLLQPHHRQINDLVLSAKWDAQPCLCHLIQCWPKDNEIELWIAVDWDDAAPGGSTWT